MINHAFRIIIKYVIITTRNEVTIIAVSYKKLWKLLIDKDLKKKDLEEMAHISHYTMNKMSRGDNVTVEMLGRICEALNCGVDDIMEFIPDSKANK